MAAHRDLHANMVMRMRLFIKWDNPESYLLPHALTRCTALTHQERLNDGGKHGG